MFVSEMCDMCLCKRRVTNNRPLLLNIHSVEISPKGEIGGLERVRDGLAAAAKQKTLTPKLRVLLCVGGGGRSEGFQFVSCVCECVGVSVFVCVLSVCVYMRLCVCVGVCVCVY